MNFLIIIILAVVAVIAMVIIAASTNKEGRRADFQRKEREQAPIKARAILTTNEQPTFLKLRKALPDCFVLAQVALSSLLSSSGIVMRNKINRCRADFVVLDKEFHVLAIVELGLSNQNGHEGKLSELDAMLLEAGYCVIRYSHAPEIERIVSDFSKITATQKPAQPLHSKTPAPNKSLLTNDDSFFDHDF